MNRKVIIALSALLVLSVAGFYNGRVAGEESANPETITYRTVDLNAEVGTEEHPFTILEIVPDKRQATMGYLIPGCEPAENLTADVAVMEAYKQAFCGYDAGTGQYASDAIATVDDGGTNCFFTDFPQDLGYDAGEENRVSNENNNNLHFGQYGYFEHVAEGQGTYKYVAPTETHQGYFAPIVPGDNGNQMVYRWVPLMNYEQSVGNVAPFEGAKKYFLSGNAYTDTACDATNENSAYFYFMEGDSEVPFYGIPLVDDVEKEGPEQNQDKVLAANAIGGAGDIVGSRFYQDRYEEYYYVYYNQTIAHKDSLIQSLFPGKSTEDGFLSQVVTVTPEQLRGVNVTAEDTNIIRDADMIVLHDSTQSIPVNLKLGVVGTGTDVYTFTDGKDLSEDCYNALIAREASGNPAIMWLDASGMDSCKTTRNGNVEKLYSLLNRYGAKYFYNVYCNGPTWEREKIPDDSTFQHGTCGNSDISLCKNPFVMNFSGDSFLFRAIVDENIKNILGTLYTKANPNVHMAGEVSADLVKTKLNILELQPIAKFIYGEDGWRSYYMGLLPNDFVGRSGDLAEDIQVTTMATYEFNGKIEDLNSTYDMILIGGAQDDTNGLNGYNDTALGHLAYTTVGDLVSTDNGTVYFDDYDRFHDVCGFIDGYSRFEEDDKHWINGRIINWNGAYYTSFIGSNKGSDIAQCNIRYNGTDVTKKRYEELLDFSLKNPIVIDGKLYKDSGEVDDTFVDSSSFIYSLAKISTGASDEHFVKRYADIRGEVVPNYSERVLKTSCEIVFSAETEEPNQHQGQDGKPVAYSYEVADGNKKTINRSTITNNDQKDENNNDVLRYHFTLYGDPNAKYKVTLGIDSNGNGSFEEDEWKENLRIVDTTPGVLDQHWIDQSKGETLQAGHTYTVTRMLPSTEVGMLPWELQVYDADTSSVRDSETGYTRIATGKKTTVKVLQMNLTPQDDMNKNMATNINFADKSTSVGKRFREYLGGVDDYDIQVTFLKNTDFYNLYGKNNNVKAWTDYLMSYDMLILGFGDMASFSDNDVFLAGFKTFVDAGKSVIMSHDMVYDKSFAYPVAGYEFDWGWQFSENRYAAWDVNVKTSAYLRELSGQVKKYYAIDPVTSQPVGSYIDTYSQGKKISTLPKSDLEVAYFYRWHYDVSLWEWQTGYWVFQPDADRYCWMDQSDYRYRLPGVREYTCNLMDNSIRAMTFVSRAKSSDKLDRVITNPSNKNASVKKSSLVWPASCETQTVKVANQGQITSYPFAMDDTITVGKTHAQNYRLDLESGEISGVDSHFRLDGEYMDWDDVPKTDGSWWTEAPDKNKGTIVYDRGVAYGYAEVNEANAIDRNGGAFSGMQVTIEQEDGVSKDFQVKFVSVAKDGTVNQNPKMEGLDPGDYTFYLVSTGFSSENINNLKNDLKKNEDMIWGEAVMHITDGQDKMEYRLDVDSIAKWERRDPLNITKVNNVIVCLTSLTNNPPSYASKDTDSYVDSLGTKKTDGAIVWYNLSNGSSDSTNIYSAKDGDSANNYYIYTKGNITYTGLGHSGDMTNDEIRLFINTMISSYRSVPAAPYVTVANSDVVNNGEVSSLYVEERGDQKDKAVLLKVNDDSTSTLPRIYRMKITRDGQPVEQLLENGQPIRKNADDTFTVKEDGLYTLVAPYGDGNTPGTIAGNGMLEYTVELTTSYQEGNKKDSVSRRVVRVMTMPLFELD